MGLVDLTTDLKSLRFGKDRIGGGSSNQPYIKSSFPESLSNTDNTGGPDFLLRGGILTPGKIAKDVFSCLINCLNRKNSIKNMCHL